MSAVGGSNYISDGAIMAWLATQQDRIYTDLKESMDMSERRADFQSALTNIKTQLNQANESQDFGDVDAKLQSLFDEYGTDPQFAEALEELKPMADKIHRDWDYKANVYPAKKEAYDAAASEALASPNRSGGGGYGAPTASINVPIPKDPVSSYDKNTIEDWQNLVGGQVDNAGRNDQMTMIHIQELKATLDQGSQLASTLISTSDRTTSAIIGNIA